MSHFWSGFLWSGDRSGAGFLQSLFIVCTGQIVIAVVVVKLFSVAFPS